MLLASCASSSGAADETVPEDGTTVPVVEVDLDVEIAVDKIVNNTSNRLECLRNDTASQNLLTQAEIIVVEPQPGPPASASFDPTLPDNDLETHRLFVEHIVALQRISAAAASERGIGSVDASLAFNGPDYDEAVPDGYLKLDGAHLTDEGSRVVAELLHGLSTT